MSSVLAFSLLSLIAGICTCGAEVLVLGDGNFHDVIEANPLVLVMFFAPWCSYSKQFLPVFEEIEKDLSSVRIPLAKVDCVVEKDLYWQHKIEGFPTLKAFVRGDPIHYKGERNYDSIVGWLQKLSSKSVVDIDSVSGLEEFKKNKLVPNTAVSVLFTDGANGEAAATVDLYDLACKKMEILPCALSTSVDDAAAAGITSLPSIAVYRSFPDETGVKFADASLYNSSDGMMEFMQLSAFPSLIELRQDTDELLFSDKRIGFHTHVLVALDKSLPVSQALIADLRVQGEEYSGKCAFAYIDTGGSPSTYTTTIMKDLGIVADKAPTAMIIRSAKTEVQFYQLADGSDVNAESMSYFVRDFFSGAIKPVRTAMLQE